MDGQYYTGYYIHDGCSVLNRLLYTRWMFSTKQVTTYAKDVQYYTGYYIHDGCSVLNRLLYTRRMFSTKQVTSVYEYS